MNTFNPWTIVGVAYPMTRAIAPAAFHLYQGRRYRVHMRNESDDLDPIHLHRHVLELTSIMGKQIVGVMKTWSCWASTRRSHSISWPMIRE